MYNPTDDITEAVVMKHVTALTALFGAFAGLWPILLALPAAVYYVMLCVEKYKGKKISELIAIKRAADAAARAAKEAAKLLKRKENENR